MNKAVAIMHIYPDASPLVDFEIWDDGDGEQYVAVWNLTAPQPTEAELQAAWEAYLEAEANKPPELTEIEKLKVRLDMSEQTSIGLMDALVALMSPPEGGE